MYIKELSIDDKIIIEEIAVLHQKAFPGFFLTQLGKTFLQTLYKGYLYDKNSNILIAEENGEIKGFLAYSNDYSYFYKELIKHRIIQFAWCSFLAFLRHPSFARRLFRAFKKSDSVEKKEKYVELASICVDPRNMGCGVGTQLIDYLKSITDFSCFEYINLETDADNNEAANAFYTKNNFVLYRQYITTEGRRMNEYRYYPTDKMK